MQSAFQFPHSSPADLQDQPAPAGQQAQQLTKEEVNYRAAGGSETNCGNCAHYLGDGVCEIVAGKVGTAGVSDAYEPRSRTMMDLIGG